MSNRPTRFDVEVEWSYTDVVLVLLAGLVGAFVGLAVLAAVAGRDADSQIVTAVGLASQTTGSLLALVVLSRRRGSGDWRQDFGLALHGADAGFLFLGAILQVALAIALSPLARLLAPEGTEQAVASTLRALETPAELGVYFLLLVVLAPVVEEVMFRGMLMSRALRSLSARGALVLQAAAFAAVHLFDPNAVAVVPGLFLVGLVLGWVTLRSGDLSRAIFLHAGVNLIAYVALVFADELRETADVAAAIVGRLG